MGRLTLNVLLSFAQFEREVTSERIRDKVAASKKKGIRVGGPLPLGYAMDDGRIAVVPEEAERVRCIFTRYLELGSVRALMHDLGDRSIVSRQRVLRTGAIRGGSRLVAGLYSTCCAIDFTSAKSITRDTFIRVSSLRSLIASCSRMSSRCSRTSKVIRPEPGRRSAIF